MRDKLKGAIIAAVVLVALAIGGAAIAGATGGGGEDDAGKAITGSALDRASKVALQKTGSGKVTGTEANDEEGAYEVEVTKADGSQVDVHLDKSFQVIDAKGDREKAGENEKAGEQDQGGDHEQSGDHESSDQN